MRGGLIHTPAKLVRINCGLVFGALWDDPCYASIRSMMTFQMSIHFYLFLHADSRGLCQMRMGGFRR